MTTAAAARIPRPARRASLAALAVSDRAALGALAVGVAALAALTWGTWGDIGQDTGYDLVAGAFVAHGHFPYADFVYYYGPLAPLLLGLTALIGGTGLAPAVALGLVLAVTVVAATYALARTQVGPLGSLAASVITAALAFAPTNLSYVLPHSLSATLATLLTLAFLLGVSRYAATQRTGALVATGLAAAGVALTRPEFELAVVIAGVAWLVLRARAGLGGRREAAVLVGIAALVPAVVYGAFLPGVSLRSLLFDNLYPVDVLRAGGDSVLRIHAPLTASSFVDIGVKLLAYGVGTAALIGLGSLALSRRRSLRGVAVTVAAAVVAAAVVDPEAARTGLQYVYGWIPLGAALLAVGLTGRQLRRGGELTARQQVYLVNTIVLAVLAAKTYAVFFFESTKTQPAVYAAPFAGVFLARLHLRDLGGRRGAALAGAGWLAFLAAVGVGLTVKDAQAKSGRVVGPGGTIAVAPAEAPMYSAAIRAIVSQTRPGEPVLIAPQLTALYTLSGRTDPLRDISLLPGAPAGPAGERAAIARLERAGVRLVIVDRVQLSEYGQTSFGVSYDRLLGTWIHRNFKRNATLSSIRGQSTHKLDVFTRRSS